MKQIKIGNGELVASQLIMGCMRIVKVPKSDADALVHTALDNGINFFDHADVYGAGKSEEVFGEILDLRSSIRDKIIIQDKCTLIRDTQQTLYNDTTKEHIIASVDGSLKRLKTDYLDTYLLHRPDTLMEADDVAEAFDYLHRSGKVRYFGVSNFKPIQIELLEKYINQRIIINQVQVSIAHTDIIDDQVTMNLQDPFMPETTGDLLDYCRLKDITIQAWSSLQYGFYGGVFMGEEGRQLYPNLNRVVDRMAQEKNSTPTQIGLAWLMRHPANIMPLIGTTNKDRMADSCKACDVELSRAEWYELYRMTLLDEGKAVLTNSNTKEEQKKAQGK